jgi:sulfur-carrier protein
MKIELRLFASFASRVPSGTPGNTCFMEVEDGSSVKDLLKLLNIGLDEPKIMFRNGIHTSADDIVLDGDRVALFPPIAGG